MIELTQLWSGQMTGITKLWQGQIKFEIEQQNKQNQDSTWKTEREKHMPQITKGNCRIRKGRRKQTLQQNQ